MGNCLGVKMDCIEQLIGGFRQGNLYTIATRPGCGKTHFCMSVACHFAKLAQRVLYISDSMDEETFEQRIEKIGLYCYGEVVFKETYHLTMAKLSEWLDAAPFDLLVIDPIDVYCWDVDIGELKELAKAKHICVLLAKTLSASLSEKNKLPTLSHIQFPSASFLNKFLAYTSVILFGYFNPKNNSVCLCVAKNEYGSIGQTIEFRR